MKQYELATFNDNIRIIDFRKKCIYKNFSYNHREMKFEESYMDRYKFYPNIIITKELVQLFLSEDITIAKIVEEILKNKINET
jgi:hypothetical protein